MIRAFIKLGTLALAGYAAYSLYDIVAQGGGGEEEEQAAPAPRKNGRHGESNPGSQRGRGKRETTEEPSGTAVSHRVGRGVVPR